MASARISELDELKLVEDRLLKEREECERLEAQIRALAGGGSFTPASSSAPQPKYAAATPPAPPNYNNYSTSLAVAQYTHGADTSVVTHSGAPPAPPEAPQREVRKGTPARERTVERSASPTSYGDGATVTDRATVRSGRAMSPSAKAGVVYRSPIYRSASPTRRVGADKVVLSNFGRSERFKEEKGWVPGPGKYQPGVSDFSPMTVGKFADDQASLGHTWSQYLSSKTGQMSAAHAHEAAMVAATARIHTNEVVERKEGDKSAFSLSGHGIHAREEEPGSSDARDAVSAATLLADAGGSARAALEGAIRRERSLHRDIAALQKQLNNQRFNTAALGGQLRTETEQTALSLQAKTAAFEGMVSRVHDVKDAFVRVDDDYTVLQNAVNELGTSLAASLNEGDVSAAVLNKVLARYPALSRVVDAARVLDDDLRVMGQHLVGMVQLTQKKSPRAIAPPATPGAASEGSARNGAATPLSNTKPSYSSLTKAMSKAAVVGSLGASADFMDARRRNAPSPPGSVDLQDAPLHGYAMNGGGGAAPVNVAAKGISSSDVMAFARRARRASEAGAAVSAAAAAVSEAFSKGYPVDRAVERANAAVAAANAAVTDASHTRRGGGGGGGSSASRSPSSDRRSRPSFAAAVGAANGRSPVHGGGSGTASRGGSPTGRHAAGVSPSGPILRRMSVGIAGLPSVLASPLPVKETTVAETLQQIFKYYSLFGDRDSDGSSLKSQQFYKLIRDAGLLTVDTRLTPADVDMAFTRAVAQGAASTSPSGKSPTNANRMRFEAFVNALNELAVRRYKGGGGGDVSGYGGVNADPDAFRLIVQDYILSIYPRLKSDAVFVVDVAQAGADETASRFAGEFTRPDVLGFFNEHRVALQAIFASFATSDRRAAGESPADALSNSASRMSKKSLMQFAHEYKIVPDMMSRPDFVALTREAARAIGRSDTSEDLTYPEWVEIVALTAFVLGDADISAQRANVVSGLGAGKGSGPGTSSLLTKINLLLFNMYELGAKYPTDAQRMLRAVSHVVREQVENANRSAVRAARASTVADMRKVQNILTESVTV